MDSMIRYCGTCGAIMIPSQFGEGMPYICPICDQKSKEIEQKQPNIAENVTPSGTILLE